MIYTIDICFVLIQIQKTRPSDCYWPVYRLDVILVVSQRYMAYQVLREKLVVEVSCHILLLDVLPFSPVVVFEITAPAPKPTSWLFLCTHLLGVGDLRRPVLRFVGVLQNPRQTVNDDTLAPGSNWVRHVWWCLIQMQCFRFNMTCTLFYHFQDTHQIFRKVMKKQVWSKRARKVKWLRQASSNVWPAWLWWFRLEALVKRLSKKEKCSSIYIYIYIYIYSIHILWDELVAKVYLLGNESGHFGQLYYQALILNYMTKISDILRKLHRCCVAIALPSFTHSPYICVI